MLSLLYNESLWSAATVYEENDITYVMSGSRPLYFYALSGNTNRNPTGAGSGFWTDKFLWKPSYSTSANLSPRVLLAQFGDGYSQRQRDGINNVLGQFSLVFENRSNKEAIAILHFVEKKAGVEAFPINMHLYKTGINVITKDVEHNYVAFDINNVTISVMQVPERI